MTRAAGKISKMRAEVRERLGALACHDLDLSARWGRSSVASMASLESTAELAAECVRSIGTVYTAFDGDHQIYSSAMRRAVLREEKVPVNPDSVLDYRETLIHRFDKRLVLFDDLAVLRGCGELWVFSDHPPVPESLSLLAEGVLVELLFFLKRNPSKPAYFVGLKGLETGRVSRDRWEHDFDQTVRLLPDDCRSGILRIANSNRTTDSKLPETDYCVMDLLDFKYARFVRSKVYEEGSRSSRRAPIVPYLAVDPSDHDDSSWGAAVESWLTLMNLGTSLVTIGSMEERGVPALLPQLFEMVWSTHLSKGAHRCWSWEEFHIPRVRLGSSWPLTQRERARMQRVDDG